MDWNQFSSVAQLCPPLWPHEQQHTRLSCLSTTPGTYSNSCPLSQWCYLAISCSAVPFPSCPQSFPTSGSFQMSQPFASGGQSIGISASISVLPMNTQDLSHLGWTGWISLKYKGLSRVFSNTTVQKHWFFSAQLSFFFFLFFFLLLFFYCSGFCHTLKWNSHGFACVPHPDPPSHLRLHPIPLGLPSAPGPSTCLMHAAWGGDLFHYR